MTQGLEMGFAHRRHPERGPKLDRGNGAFKLLRKTYPRLRIVRYEPVLIAARTVEHRMGVE